jgi:hypothetical protein
MGRGGEARYSFLTTWLLQSPREPVWDVIYDEAAWPEWWRGVEVAEEVRPGNPDGVGTISRMVWRSLLPYRVEFEVTATKVERFSLMEGQATGDLEGTVITTKAWMNRMAPLLRPVFEWNHDWVMRRGGEGIAARLGVPLLALD